MNNILTAMKAFFVTAVALLSNWLGILGPVLVALTIAMVIDYITGMAASKKEGTLSSRVGLKGILKKLGYVAAIAAAMILDWLILTVAGEVGLSLSTNTIFGLLVAVWFILNELLSITENLGRVGVPLPAFLKKAIAALKGSVEQKGDEQSQLTEGENDDE